MSGGAVIVGEHAGALELRLSSDIPGRGVSVDFSSFRAVGLAHHPLVRAVGRDTHAVIDATAGLGHDAWLLAARGLRVLAIERCEAVRTILADGLRRASHHPSLADTASRITLVEGDSIAVLRDCTARATAAGDARIAIFLDPMYPEFHRGSALPPRDIRLVRAAAGDDADAPQLFAAACAVVDAPGVQRPLRVVVRRPTRAPPMPIDFGASPCASPCVSLNAQFESKLVRYDLYLVQ